MGLTIATNVPAITAQAAMGRNQRIQENAMAQISTGSRITKAADDAAGLSISEGLKSDIRSLGQAKRNANDGISLIQVAEGALGEVSSMMTRFRELAIQAASDTVGDKERGFIQKEVDQLKSEVERIAQSTKFGDKNLLNGTGDVFDFQVGINGDPETNAVSFDSSNSDATLDTLGIADIDFSDKNSAKSALESIDNAQDQVNGYRATLGAFQNRLVSTNENISSSIENASAANSRIRDADLAAASSELTKSNVLLNATTSVLGQANAAPQQALRLIG